MTSVILPDSKIGTDKIPEVKIKSIHFENFKAFGHHTFDFTDGDNCKPFICFHGPNGTGKSTILDAVSMIFSKYDGREMPQLIALLGKSVRHIDGDKKAMYDQDTDFLISACIKCSMGDYDVQLTKKGFVKDHPVEIKNAMHRMCFYAKYDQELHKFQLIRSKWDIFKELFKAVTGFDVKEKTTVFNDSINAQQSEIANKYISEFMVYKPNEIISHRECSAGERKIIKSFSTLLNKEISPSIVCIDNAEMHVESGRHIQLIESMKKCFPNSQIFATTHSYQISRNFGKRNQLYDLRLINAPSIIKNEPWRLYIADEIKDGISKLKSMSTIDENVIREWSILGEGIIEKCYNDHNSNLITADAAIFLSNVAKFFINDITSYYDNLKGLEK